MSVVAAAAVGPAPVAPPPTVPYGLCGGGAGKRKDVLHQEEDVAAEDGKGISHGRGGNDDGGAHGLFVLETVEEEHEAEGERSSTGAVSEEEEEEEEEEGEEEVESKETWRRMRRKKGGLTCLDALDDALPIKRGLSSFFSGKSRSFANLQDVAGTTSAKDVLAKPENPFNKRRRILRCSSIRRVSSTSLTALPPFLPPGLGPSFNDAMINGGGGGGGSG